MPWKEFSWWMYYVGVITGLLLGVLISGVALGQPAPPIPFNNDVPPPRYAEPRAKLSLDLYVDDTGIGLDRWESEVVEQAVGDWTSGHEQFDSIVSARRDELYSLCDVRVLERTGAGVGSTDMPAWSFRSRYGERHLELDDTLHLHVLDFLIHASVLQVRGMTAAPLYGQHVSHMWFFAEQAEWETNQQWLHRWKAMSNILRRWCVPTDSAGVSCRGINDGEWWTYRFNWLHPRDTHRLPEERFLERVVITHKWISDYGWDMSLAVGHPVTKREIYDFLMWLDWGTGIVEEDARRIIQLHEPPAEPENWRSDDFEAR